MSPLTTLPPEVKAALDRGDKILAIQRWRQATGQGLQEAKEAVERLQAEDAFALAPSVVGASSAPSSTGEAIDSALQQGRTLDAIRLVREQRGLGLKEAKEAVDALLRQRSAGLSGGGEPEVSSPGEVRPSTGGRWLALALIALVVIVAVVFVRRLPGVD